MKNYSEMTDFEINCWSRKPPAIDRLSHNMAGKAHRKAITAVVAIGPNGPEPSTGVTIRKMRGHYLSTQNRRNPRQTAWRVESGPQKGG
jgi:hypothetical protein